MLDLTPIFTIGYGGGSFHEMAALPQAQEIACPVDLRTAPHSPFRPEFGKAALEASLPNHGIRYIFLGDALGGRPEDRDCYLDDKVDYDLVRQKEFFRRGVERLRKAHAQGLRMALICSEGKPEECHRSKLIAPALADLGISVVHL